MAVQMRVLTTREEWLKARSKTIGGSDAAVIIGASPWQDNVTLWKIKTGQKKQADIADNAAVQFGINAEPHLRALFALDFPQYKVEYVENNIWFNSDYPFAHNSADGWLTDKDGRLGVLEIKTTNILQSMQNEKWRDEHIPDNYYAQICHAMAVMNAEFAVVFAHLRYEYGGKPHFNIKPYFFERSDCEEDIAFLMEQEKEFAKLIVTKTPPARKLPEI